MEYQKLVNVYRELEKTSKKLDKTRILSEFLKKVSASEMAEVVLLLQGKVFPDWDERKVGIAARIVLKAIHTAAGVSVEEVEERWKKLGDLGDVAEALMSGKKQVTLFSSTLSVKKVVSNLQKLSGLEGEGTVERKVQLVAELLTSASPSEAKYLIRTILEELRVGVAEGIMRDAIVWAFFGDVLNIGYDKEKNELLFTSREDYQKYADAVQRAYDWTNDFSVVAVKASSLGLKGLESLDIEVFKPVKVMLALKVRDVHEGFERCGKEIDAEYKLDGFRIQAHKDGKKIMLFTRRLENVTNQFPDVVESIQSHISGRSFIIDCEAAGFDPKTGRYIPFQNISQRIRRKYSIGETAEEFPVEVNVFDVLYYDGASLINKHFIERRALLEKCIKPAKRKLVAVRNLISSSEKSVEQFYKESLKAGNEGIMIKALDAPYKPGARVGYMNKLKPVMDTLDLAIVGAEWGEGKRSQWLSSFTLACRDEDGNFLEIGKVGTGIKEKEDLGVSFEQLTSLLKPLILEEQGKVARVKPKIVVEVKFEEIQKSPTYGSGYALRFPRLVQIREERDAEDCSTLDVVEESFRGQK